MPFHAARFVLRVIAHPDAAFFAMIVATFAAFIVCAAIEFTPDVNTDDGHSSPVLGTSPRGPVDDAVNLPGILTTIESE